MGVLVDISSVSEDALHLKNMMDGVLERVCTIYQSYNVPLPNRKYWTLGTPSVDCEQLVVAFNQLYLGPPGAEVGEPQRCNNPRSATITISVAREIPTVGNNGRPPTADRIEQSSHISAIDAWVLMESVKLLDLWDEFGFGLGVISTVDAADPEGGFQIISMEVTMAVP